MTTKTTDDWRAWARDHLDFYHGVVVIEVADLFSLLAQLDDARAQVKSMSEAHNEERRR